jgi:hypothetical protein
MKMSGYVVVSRETEALARSIEDRLDRGEPVPSEDFERFLYAVYATNDDLVPMPESSGSTSIVHGVSLSRFPDSFGESR